jgi:hypothetical protein
MKIKYKSSNHLQMTSSYTGCVAITTKGRWCGHTIFDDIRGYCKTHAHTRHEYLQYFHAPIVPKLVSFHEFTEVYDSITYTVTTQDVRELNADALVVTTVVHHVTIDPAMSEYKARGIKYTIGMPEINYVPSEEHADLTDDDEQRTIRRYGDMCDILQKYKDIHTLIFVVPELHPDIIDTIADINVSTMIYRRNMDKTEITNVTFAINSDIERIYLAYYDKLRHNLPNETPIPQIILKDEPQLKVGYHGNSIELYSCNDNHQLNIKAQAVVTVKAVYDSPITQKMFRYEGRPTLNKYHAEYFMSLSIPIHIHAGNDEMYNLTGDDFTSTLNAILRYDYESIIFDMFPNEENTQLSTVSIHNLITTIKSWILTNKWENKIFKFIVRDNGNNTSIFDTWYRQIKTVFATPQQQVETHPIVVPPIVPTKPILTMGTVPIVKQIKGNKPIPVVPTVSTNINPASKIAVQRHVPTITRTPIVYTTASRIKP